MPLRQRAQNGRQNKVRESAGKPGSVEDGHSSRAHVTVRLEQPTRERVRAAPCDLRRVFPYLVLLRVGFSLPHLLPAARCALTAPFHPYRPSCEDVGGIFSVALSVGSRLPGITWHPALWSPDFPPPRCRGGDRLGQLSRRHITLMMRRKQTDRGSTSCSSFAS